MKNDDRVKNIGNILTEIGADVLINQIAETLCEVDVERLCEVANLVLAANHSPAGEDADGYDLISQTWTVT